MVKFGVWFVGNEQQQEGLCYESGYDNETVFLTNDPQVAKDKVLELSSLNSVDESFYTVVRIEI